MNNLIPIVFAMDHRFLIPTLVAIHSLLRSAKGSNYTFIILNASDVEEEDKINIIKQVKSDSRDSQVKFINPGYDVSSLYIKDKRFSQVTYYRLFIPWLLPEYDKVIYADGDIIFNADLSLLYNDFNIGDNYFAGVNKDSYQCGERLQNILTLGLKPSKYVNAGFLLVNCKKQREDNLFHEFERYLEKNYKFYDQDQDIINLVAKNKIALLPKEYNLPPDNIYKERISNYKLIHYTLGGKPWENFTWGWMVWWNCYKELLSFDEEFYFSSLQRIYQMGVWEHENALQHNFIKKILNALIIKIKQLCELLSGKLRKNKTMREP